MTTTTSSPLSHPPTYPPYRARPPQAGLPIEDRLLADVHYNLALTWIYYTYGHPTPTQALVSPVTPRAYSLRPIPAPFFRTSPLHLFCLPQPIGG